MIVAERETPTSQCTRMTLFEVCVSGVVVSDVVIPGVAVVSGACSSVSVEIENSCAFCSANGKYSIRLTFGEVSASEAAIVSPVVIVSGVCSASFSADDECSIWLSFLEVVASGAAEVLGVATVSRAAIVSGICLASCSDDGKCSIWLTFFEVSASVSASISEICSPAYVGSSGRSTNAKRHGIESSGLVS